MPNNGQDPIPHLAVTQYPNLTVVAYQTMEKGRKNKNRAQQSDGLGARYY